MSKEITRRRLLIGSLAFIIACGKNNDSYEAQTAKREGAQRDISVPYFPDTVLVPEQTPLRKLPKEDAELIPSHPQFHIANAVAFDPTGLAYKPKSDKDSTKDNLWLGFPVKDNQYWLKWEHVKNQFLNDRGEMVDPDILFGGPGEKPDEIKVKNGKVIRILVFERK